MERTSFAGMHCAIARSLEQVGEWWSVLILRDVFLGMRRFQALQENLGIAPTTLTRRLETLCDHGLLARHCYSQRPKRYEYTLTEKGEDFLPVILSLANWGNRWLYADRPALLLVNAETGKPVDLELVDRRTGHAVRPGSVMLKPGPAAQGPLRSALASPRTFGQRSKARTSREVAS
jgi:DNA-binding HxlR family transcriptional regulator